VTESRRHFSHRVNKALDDPDLQRALVHALTGLRARRDTAFESFDFAKGRADLKQRRRANLERLPELVEQFKTRLEAVGGKVHFARDAAEARDIIAQICWNAGSARTDKGRMVVTKVKSMAAEEIELNPFLEALGMEVVETDLGERMVQLTHTHPSHLIAPAIHLTKEDAARVFGTEATVEAIQQHARVSLREKFIEATVGISGANMAIAETGTIVLVTNEGNADLTTTLPPVHIALFGIDKVVASLDDAVAVLRMLPRSGTGQIMSSYVNWITGPSRSADIEQSLTIGVHGPREMHCVILDNGRMPAIHGGERPSVRPHLQRTYRSCPHTVPPRPRGVRPPQHALHAVQRVPGDLPGRHPSAAPDTRAPEEGSQVAAQESGARVVEAAGAR